MSLKSGGTWKCRFNCNQEYHLRRYGRGCKHLEAMLGPVVGQDARRVIYTEDIHVKATAASAEDLLIQKEAADREEYLGIPEQSDEEARLHSEMRAAGLNSRRAHVVIDRVLHNKTFQEIAIDRNYARAQGARQAFEDAKKFLAKKGFKK